MADDILNRIKQAEEEATEAVAEAKELSTQIIRDARTKAESEYKSIISDANKKASSLIEAATSEAQIAKEPVLQAARENSKKIENINKADVDKLIDSLTERIIVDGNS
eukprot:TRINITY_DN6647_c0_g1_i1.p1 TRINITY_DN6647_c0_g1~~TRINITY_DN6647_c0_g1_i1.p1  ORF type:complete len:108 (-),score=3.23 TRINITY_DN6647_c0_g1_i1:75-398(-)